MLTRAKTPKIYLSNPNITLHFQRAYLHAIPLKTSAIFLIYLQAHYLQAHY